jgi:capsular exopolysaccharide synthesis family protein
MNGKKRLLLKNKPPKHRDDIIVREGKKDYMNEAFRVIRTNLDFILGTNGEKHQKVSMFTSFNTGSGKTFTAINLAISMAIKGKKVVVVDLDMRKASLSTYIDSPRTGVSNYLGNMTDNVENIIVKETIHPNLDIVPVGTIPPNPAELLLGNKLPELLNTLKEKYDYIFLDCTPAGIVTDASIVGKITDLTIFVVRAGLMDRRMLPEIGIIYEKEQFNNMTLLLNGTKYMQRYGYSHYGYGYSY